VARPLDPDLQVAFSLRLEQIDHSLLGPALLRTLREVDIRSLASAYSTILDEETHRMLAALQIRPEAFFPCEPLLRANPALLGYYRLLYGFSEKEFYLPRHYGAYRSMEQSGRLPGRAGADLRLLCSELVQTGKRLLAGLPRADARVIRDLQLLTLGPAMRGSNLNTIGRAAIEAVLGLIREAIGPGALIEASPAQLCFRNAAGRSVTVAVAGDPDVTIVEDTGSGVRKILAIEVKGGSDVSNIHNRIGEAEKSHQKARADGFRECWTILGATVDTGVAARESPTTDEFFVLAEILRDGTPGQAQFLDGITSRVGLPAAPRP
jgi:hypothetical protein